MNFLDTELQYITFLLGAILGKKNVQTLKCKINFIIILFYLFFILGIYLIIVLIILGYYLNKINLIPFQKINLSNL